MILICHITKNSGFRVLIYFRVQVLIPSFFCQFTIFRGSVADLAIPLRDCTCIILDNASPFAERDSEVSHSPGSVNCCQRLNFIAINFGRPAVAWCSVSILFLPWFQVGLAHHGKGNVPLTMVRHRHVKYGTKRIQNSGYNYDHGMLSLIFFNQMRDSHTGARLPYDQRLGRKNLNKA